MKRLTDEMSEVFFAFARMGPGGPVPFSKKKKLLCAARRTETSLPAENGVYVLTERFHLLSKDAEDLHAGDMLERQSDGAELTVTADASRAPLSSPLDLYLFSAERKTLPGANNG